MTLVVQSSSTKPINRPTSLPSGRYTSKSPFTLRAGSFMSSSNRVPSRKPEVVTKYAVIIRKTSTVAIGKRVIAPVAPDFCHSRLNLSGASRTASIADFALKSLTLAVKSTAPDWILERLYSARAATLLENLRLSAEGALELSSVDIGSPHTCQLNALEMLAYYMS